MRHKENPNCSATLRAAAYPLASSHHCKGSVICAARDAQGTLEDGIMPSHRDGMGSRHRAGVGSGSTRSLCGFDLLCVQPQNPLFNAKNEKIPQSRVILTASVDSGSAEVGRGVQPASKQLPLPFFRLACALVSKIT